MNQKPDRIVLWSYEPFSRYVAVFGSLSHLRRKKSHEKLKPFHHMSRSRLLLLTHFKSNARDSTIWRLVCCSLCGVRMQLYDLAIGLLLSLCAIFFVACCAALWEGVSVGLSAGKFGSVCKLLTSCIELIIQTLPIERIKHSLSSII